MKEDIRYLKLFIWCSMLFTWVLLNKLMCYDYTTIAIAGILAIAAVIMLTAKIRKYISITPIQIPLSDNNIAAMLFVLGLGSLVDNDNAYYFFLVAVTVAGVVIDACNRYFEENG